MDLERLRSAYDHCFGCGAANPIGLQLDGFERRGDSVTTEFTPNRDHAGFAEALHGGIVTTALDEISAWSAMMIHEVLVFTATLDVRFRSPAPPERTYRLTGHVVDRRSSRLRIEASMDHEGRTVASSSGLFVVAEEETRRLFATSPG